jgi:hypothetical protein
MIDVIALSAHHVRRRPSPVEVCCLLQCVWVTKRKRPAAKAAGRNWHEL